MTSPDSRHPDLAGYQSAAELRAAIRRIQHQSEQIARRQGMTPQRHALLLMIKGAPDGSERSTVTELVDRLRLTPSTVTELVARAEGAGLIARVPDALDGRVSWLALTPDAEGRLAATMPEVRRERERLRDCLDGSA